MQTPANVFNGRPFLYVEGESASTFNAPVDGITWKIATKGGPDMSIVIAGTGERQFPLCQRRPMSLESAIWAPSK